VEGRRAAAHLVEAHWLEALGLAQEKDTVRNQVDPLLAPHLHLGILEILLTKTSRLGIQAVVGAVEGRARDHTIAFASWQRRRWQVQRLDIRAPMRRARTFQNLCMRDSK